MVAADFTSDREIGAMVGAHRATDGVAAPAIACRLVMRARAPLMHGDSVARAAVGSS